MIRFVHTADIHFGMENYGRIDPLSGIHTRLLDFDRALSFCVDTAINEKVDFFLFSGDAYKTAHPSPTQQQLFLKSFLRLYQAKIPVVIVVGNHDMGISFGRAHALDIFSQLPLDGFHVIAKPAIVRLNTKGGPISIVGIPWPSRTTLALSTGATTSSQEITKLISEKVAGLISQFAQELNQNEPALLAAHLTVSSGIFSGSEKKAIYGSDPLFLPSQLGLPPFDYVALGHLHRFQQLNPAKNPPIVYPGSLERIDFGERKEEKGFCLVTLKSKHNVDLQFVKTPTRPFVQIEVYLKGETSHTEQLSEAIKKHAIENAVVKIIYHVPDGIKDRVSITTIQSLCEKAHYLVGIIPVRTHQIKTKRTLIKPESSLAELLHAYFSSKPELASVSNRLIQKALSLQEECKEQNTLAPLHKLTGEFTMSEKI